MTIPQQTTKKGSAFFCLLALALAGALVYARVLEAPFVFDDYPDIVDNPGIHSLESLGRVLGPPLSTGLYGRPLASLSLALDWALSGGRPWSFHLTNLALHVFSAWFLTGLVRRTRMYAGAPPRSALAWGLAAGLLWVVHPLATSAVALGFRRPEILMAFFFLAGLLAFVRAWAAEKGTGWQALAVGCMLLGAMAKEVILVLPLVALAWAWVFGGEKPLSAFRARPWMFGGFGLVWLFQALLLAWGGGLARASAVSAASYPAYLASQAAALCKYLALALWPVNLCMDYGNPRISFGLTAFCLALAGCLLAVSLWGLGKRKAWGFWAVFALLALAPTSLAPMPDPIFEHRAYLSLACLVVLGVAAGARAFQRLGKRFSRISGREGKMGAAAACVVFVVLASLSAGRLEAYRSPVAIWTDTLEKCPDNPRAFFGLGTSMDRMGRAEEAAALYRKALEKDPEFVPALTNLAGFYLNGDQPEKSRELLLIAAEKEPANPALAFNLASAHERLGDWARAALWYGRAAELDPSDLEARFLEGRSLRLSGQPGEAARVLSELLRIMPHHLGVQAEWNLAVTQTGRAGK